MRQLNRRITLPLAATSVAVTAGLISPTASAAPDPGKDVIANLWSWNWKSVGSECSDVLGPSGYAAVWVAPPAESLSHPKHHWWDIYQPYSYQLSGRFGSEADFAAMAKACNAAGVKVYTDAVINHTGAQTGTGYAGTKVTDKYQPAMYQKSDYNVDACDRTITNWDDKWEVQHCELLELPDLKTSSAAVREKITGYLNSQIKLGVSGFRVDAAKHIPADELKAVVDGLDATADGSKPYVFHEVYPGKTPTPDEYYGSGDVLDFSYADQLKAAFQGDIASLKDFGNNGLLPGENAVSFVTNHDTERNGRHLTYKDGDTAVLANVFQLGWKRATPAVYAGFTFSDPEASPPADADGMVTDTKCGDGWYCLDRDPRVTGMVGWRAAVGDEDVTDFQSPQGNVIGFGRGAKGFVAINNSGSAVTAEFSTAVADGTYANALDGGETKVTVSGGKAKLDLPAKGAVAFHPEAG
ncbi:alpha-amylase [Streptomyces boninensis]|uniref:alpha-amylase n=1 Tax=Streptomyces boninensis TaxID=2039455 RepID=UPI003B228610